MKMGGGGAGGGEEVLDDLYRGYICIACLAA